MVKYPKTHSPSKRHQIEERLRKIDARIKKFERELREMKATARTLRQSL